MSERNEYPNGVPCWVTAIQPDCHAGAGFYSQVLGWDCTYDDGFFTARVRGREVAAVAPRPEGVTDGAWITNVYADDPAATAELARNAGGTILAEPFDVTGGRLAVIADPAGGVFGAWRGRGAELVNEPGAYAMSRLDTPDPQRAAEFYGAVFGWTTEAFGDAFTLFRLPGYVGGEPEQPVSREVVAAMARADAPARWSVDFWVDDVDATAERARTGGSVLTGPSDTPMGRTAVLADPFGAAFSVSRVAKG